MTEHHSIFRCTFPSTFRINTIIKGKNIRRKNTRTSYIKKTHIRRTHIKRKRTRRKHIRRDCIKRSYIKRDPEQIYNLKISYVEVEVKPNVTTVGGTMIEAGELV